MKLLRISISLILLFLSADLFAGQKEITIIHTNDLHSHILGFSPNLDYRPDMTGGDETKGGLARVATGIKREKEKRDHPVLVLDGGDFLMGSLFHMLAREEAMELRLMKDMGYDAMTLGNHEFDLKPKGLARILHSAAAKGGMPPIVFSNAVFSKESDRDDALEEAFNQGLVKPYMVLQKGGMKIGIFGIMGKDAAEKSPFASPVTFRDPIETSREMVKALREKEKVDMVICLSHSGVREAKSISEDEALAQKVPGIDVIVGGHSHTRLEKPILINSTLILQASAYGKCVGVLDLLWESGKVRQKTYRLIDIDSSIPGDMALQKKINSFLGTIDRDVLQKVNLTSKKVIGQSAFDLTIKEEESNLGNLIADAIRWWVNKHDSDPGDPRTKVAVAIESNGLIRDNLVRGKTGALAVTDVFAAIPLGIGMDDTMGYPLISCYFYASEIKKALEVLTSVYPRKGSSYFLQVSGLKFTYNPRRVIFDRVTDIWMGNEEEGYLRLDYSESNKSLYRITTNIYNAAFLKIIGKYTYQVLNVIPKDLNGNPIDDLTAARVDADKNQSGVQELKEWIGVMEYIKSFPDTSGDGIPDVPEKYRGKLGRIVVQASWNPVSLLSKGTMVTWGAFSAIVICLLLLALIAGYGVRVARRRRGSQGLT
ncbi:MAG TPA: bifunctional UDP-sugar hydrolase/5'-nucleotidase [Thermodesulfobacteriota bacterium]|nr:bifunctional UDP-sugar hydrolase/5'-nucleotidase [Thermodesulfobacteriota bacterium]